MLEPRQLDEQEADEAHAQPLADFDSLPPLREVSPSEIEDEDGDSFYFDCPMPQNQDIHSVKPDAIDSMVAKELASLSIQDREKVYSDVHGVSRTIDETPEFIRDSLQQLELELSKLVNSPAYDTAKEMDPTYVKDEGFRLMFLRADLFDAKKAAKRIGFYFQHKLDLFGKELLTKNITQDCLSEEAIRVLYLGNFRLLEERDSSGRALFVNFLAGTDVSIKSKIQAAYYIAMLAVEDLETQRRGCVGISYLISNNPAWLQLSPHRHEWNIKMGQLSRALPFRIEAMQMCHNSFATRVFVAVFKLGGDKGIRVRMREHYGTRQECLFSLQTFGIPTHCFPVDNEGNILTERHVEMMKKRRKLEQIQEKRDQGRICVPSRIDILFGRGKAYYRHVGNMRLRSMVEERAPEYEASKVAAKKRIRDEVVSAVRATGGRFLRDDGAGWVEVSDSVAGEKVAHAFRTLRAMNVVVTAKQEGGLVSDEARNKQIQAVKRGRLD